MSREEQAQTRKETVLSLQEERIKQLTGGGLSAQDIETIRTMDVDSPCPKRAQTSTHVKGWTDKPNFARAAGRGWEFDAEVPELLVSEAAIPIKRRKDLDAELRGKQQEKAANVERAIYSIGPEGTSPNVEVIRAGSGDYNTRKEVTQGFFGSVPLVDNRAAAQERGRKYYDMKR